MKPHKAKLRIVDGGKVIETDQEVTLVCTHAERWPPPLALLKVDHEAMWKAGEMTQHDFQQMETWSNVCGLMEMNEPKEGDEDKCWGCPLAIVRHTDKWTGKHTDTPLAKAQADKLAEIRRSRKK